MTWWDLAVAVGVFAVIQAIWFLGYLQGREAERRYPRA